MAACADDICTGSKMGDEGFGPRANHDRNFVYKEDIDAAVGQDSLCEFNGGTYRLSPEAKQVHGDDRISHSPVGAW
jgi:hypothetical protein